MHIICTICTDVITQDDLQSMYVTSCGHVFHHTCLTQWTERSPSCPQCRNKINSKLMFRVYLTLSEETKHDNVLMESLLNTQAKLHKIIKDRDAELDEINSKLDERERMLREYEKMIYKNEKVIAKMRKQLAASKKQTDESARLSLENTKLRERLIDLSVKKSSKKSNENIQPKKTDDRKPAKKRQHKQFRDCAIGIRKRRSKDNNGNLQYASSDSMLDSSNSSSSSDSDSSNSNSDSDVPLQHLKLRSSCK